MLIDRKPVRSQCEDSKGGAKRKTQFSSEWFAGMKNPLVRSELYTKGQNLVR